MNKIFRIVWNEAAQAWVAVSELTKKHKKRASATAVAAALVVGLLSPFAEATKNESEPLKNLAPGELGTDNYFRVTTTNTGDPNDGYLGCPNGNVEAACPDTEMNIGVLGTDSKPTEEDSDNSRLVLEGNKGIRLTRNIDDHTAHKITFDAPVKAADGSDAISIKQPVEGENAGYTIIKSEIKSGSPDKIKVESKDGETTITWVGGDTAGGGAAGGAAGDKGPTGDKGEKGEQGDKGLQGDKGERGDKGLQGDKGEKGDTGRRVIEGNGITATVDSVNDTLTIAAKTKRWY